jgi:repressor LexA
MDVAKKLRALREARGLSREKLGRMADVSGSYLGRLESGERKRMGLEVAAKIAEALEIDIHEFFEVEPVARDSGYRVDRGPRRQPLREVAQTEYGSPSVVMIPIRGSVPGSLPLQDKEQAEGYVTMTAEQLGRATQKAYALRVLGNSLLGDGIYPNDLVVIDPAAKVINGRVYVLRLDKEIVARHVYREEGELRLIATDGSYDVLGADQAEILGRVVLSGGWRRH